MSPSFGPQSLSGEFLQLTSFSFDSGGEEVLLDVGGQDATEAFEDVGHSDEARETLDQLYLGDLKRQVSLNNDFSSAAIARA